MGATTSQGTGPGAADNIKPKILNGAVTAGNVQPQSLQSYHGDINAVKNNGDIYGNNVFASGDLQVYGNNYTNGNMQVNANINATGWVRGHAVGQVLNVSVNTSSGTFTNSASGTFTDIMSVNYVPVSSQSKIVVSFDAGFSMNGTGTDSFRSQIVVSGNPIITRDQSFSSGGFAVSMRGNTLFPISYVYTNATTASTTIAVQAAPLLSDDSVTVNKSQAILTITEIAR